MGLAPPKKGATAPCRARATWSIVKPHVLSPGILPADENVRAINVTRFPTTITHRQNIIMTKISTPRDLLIEEVKDLYSAENQILEALPKMAEAATSEELREAFEAHLQETKMQVERLETIGEKLGESMQGKKCKAMEGLVEEGEEIMEEDATPAMLDLALIGAAQKVEHYEIAGYGTSRTLAELSDEKEIAELLQETLDEEGKTDKLLTEIAAGINLETAVAGAEDEQS